jgi:hypothetical protein
MFPANAKLDIAARCSSALGGKFDKLANPIDIERDEGIAREDAFFDIGP